MTRATAFTSPTRDRRRCDPLRLQVLERESAVGARPEEPEHDPVVRARGRGRGRSTTSATPARTSCRPTTSPRWCEGDKDRRGPIGDDLLTPPPERRRAHDAGLQRRDTAGPSRARRPSPRSTATRSRRCSGCRPARRSSPGRARTASSPTRRASSTCSIRASSGRRPRPGRNGVDGFKGFNVLAFAIQIPLVDPAFATGAVRRPEPELPFLGAADRRGRLRLGVAARASRFADRRPASRSAKVRSCRSIAWAIRCSTRCWSR